MKTKYAMVILTMGMSVAAMAQENDDMYFNSKDRLVVNQANEQLMAKRYQAADRNAVLTNPVNPSDSYSGRGVNPEYNAQGKNGTAVIQDNPDYFLSSYQPKNINSSLSSGNNTYNSAYNGYGMNPYYGYGGMGSSMMGYGMGYGMNSMMGYGMGYGMNSMMGYGMGYGYPYSMFSMGYGMSSYGSGFYGGYGMGYGMGSMYSPYGMYGMGSMYYPYGNGYGYGGGPYGGYSGGVINETHNTSYGRHSVRSSGLNNYVDNSRGTSSVTNPAGVGRGNQSGRTAGSQPDYYNSGWRNNATNMTRSGYDNSGNSGWGNTRSGNSGWGNSGTRSSMDSFGGGSRGSFGGGGGGGFSGGGGGGGGGHSRGRN